MAATTVSTTAEYTVQDQERMKRAQRYFEWQAFLAQTQLGQRVLEVGCGMGNFTSHLLNRELVIGLDVVSECIAQHRERFAGRQHIESRVLDILDPAVVELRDRKLDSIVCLNVLEHISDDALALRHIHELLPPGGRAVFILPAFQSLYGPIDERLGHYRRYSKSSWRRLAESCGFRPSIIHYMNVAGFFGWWVNARILRKTEQSEGQIALFDSVVVPVMSRAERWIKPPFGQSVFTVLVRE